MVGEYGSLGCSGDLAPLSHCALALMGEGRVRDAAGREQDAATALAAAGLEPLELQEKEGLALINGTDGMLGMLTLAIADLHRLLTTADVAAAMSVEGLLGTDAVFAADLQALRPQPGQAESAENIRTVLHGSVLVEEQKTGAFTRVQDAYSLRCAPQVHGAARSTLAHAEHVAACELASAVDNPVVTPDGRVESNGNFHGAPVGYVLDFLAIAVADVASMSERRTDRFLDRNRSHGLNAFLADDPGVDSGHMIAQYTQAGHCLRAEAAGGSGVGGFDSVLGNAGRPRVNGLGGRAEAAPGPGRTGPGTGSGSAYLGAGPGYARRRPGHRPQCAGLHGGPLGGPFRGAGAWAGPVPGTGNRGRLPAGLRR